jgi:uncharacterized protein (TIGR02594 family)
MINGAGRQPYFETARRELGVHEIVGLRHNPRVLQYHTYSRLKAKDDETAWCASFLNYCLETSGFTSTKSAAAASYKTWGQPCDVREDAIVVFGKHDPDAKGTGHVAIVDHLDDDGIHVWVLGGNQNNAVSVARRRIDDIVASRWPLV